MRRLMPNHLRPVPHSPEIREVVIETDEHEVIEIHGCSEEEIEAKVHDFYLWAS